MYLPPTDMIAIGLAQNQRLAPTRLSEPHSLLSRVFHRCTAGNTAIQARCERRPRRQPCCERVRASMRLTALCLSPRRSPSHGALPRTPCVPAQSGLVRRMAALHQLRETSCYGQISVRSIIELDDGSLMGTHPEAHRLPIVRSQDAGASWQEVGCVTEVDKSKEISDSLIFCVENSTLYCACCLKSLAGDFLWHFIFCKSLDNGASWTFESSSSRRRWAGAGSRPYRKHNQRVVICPANPSATSVE